MTTVTSLTTRVATSGPDPDQALLEQSAKHLMAMGMVRLGEYLATPGADPEVVIKIINSAVKDISKVVPEKKVDPHAGLAVFNVTIGRGVSFSVGQATPPPGAPPAQDIELLQDLTAQPMSELEAAVRAELAAWVPPADMSVVANINADLDGLDD